MPVFNFFKKEIECEICGIKLNKSEVFGFDSTLRGENKEGENLKLCKNCFLKKTRQAIQKFQGRAVFYYPIKKKNAYHFYKFNSKVNEKIDYENCEDFPPTQSHKLLPNKDQRCGSCGREAKFSWCKSEAFEQIDTYNVSEIPNKLILTEYLCSECLIDRFSKALEVENIIFSEYFPPVDDDGICLSGEC